ncbi:helix-turn-helix domain-containing protein [Streptomyces sp. NBC_00354]|uniref:helix-turn-helix domain-containing protein n=1 Tax=Streptomyces sp. NBC_00354 TaxID=2975723 RepID=UPI002E257E06
MTKDGKPRPLAAIVGERLRLLRAEKDLRQDDVAEAAKHFGLTWGRSSVAALEGGNRDLKFEELALLPSIVKRLGGWSQPLLPPDEQVLLGESVWIEAHRLGPAITTLTFGDPFGGASAAEATADSDEFFELGAIEGESPEDPFETLKDASRRVTFYNHLLATLWPTKAHLSGATNKFLGSELSRRLAERLTSPDDTLPVDHVLVETIATGMWGKSVTEERDSRAAQRGEYETKRALQSARGHVTREILDELQGELNLKWSEISRKYKELCDAMVGEAELKAWREKVYTTEIERDLSAAYEALADRPRKRSLFSRGKHRS